MVRRQHIAQFLQFWIWGGPVVRQDVVLSIFDEIHTTHLRLENS